MKLYTPASSSHPCEWTAGRYNILSEESKRAILYRIEEHSGKERYIQSQRGN
jgi:hypothetical protein